MDSDVLSVPMLRDWTFIYIHVPGFLALFLTKSVVNGISFQHEDPKLSTDFQTKNLISCSLGKHTVLAHHRIEEVMLSQL